MSDTNNGSAKEKLRNAAQKVRDGFMKGVGYVNDGLKQGADAVKTELLARDCAKFFEAAATPLFVKNKLVFALPSPDGKGILVPEDDLKLFDEPRELLFDAAKLCLGVADPTPVAFVYSGIAYPLTLVYVPATSADVEKPDPAREGFIYNSVLYPAALVQELSTLKLTLKALRKQLEDAKTGLFNKGKKQDALGMFDAFTTAVIGGGTDTATVDRFIALCESVDNGVARRASQIASGK
jgi:hypothetical protein